MTAAPAPPVSANTAWTPMLDPNAVHLVVSTTGPVVGLCGVSGSWTTLRRVATCARCRELSEK